MSRTDQGAAPCRSGLSFLPRRYHHHHPNTIGNVVGDGASIVMELRLEERLAVAAPRHAGIWEQRSSWCAVASQGQVLLRGSAAAWHRVLPPLKTVLVG
jgi:hypothetical protein